VSLLIKAFRDLVLFETDTGIRLLVLDIADLDVGAEGGGGACTLAI